MCLPSNTPKDASSKRTSSSIRTPAPIISDEKIERTTERSHAAREPRLEVVLGGGLMHSLARNRLDDGNQILDAMTELIRDEAQVLIFLA